MNKNMKACVVCGDRFIVNPHVKNHRCCKKKECKRILKAGWQRRKMRTDPDYQEDKKRNEREWHKAHPRYYRQWRASHPEYVERNRTMQGVRNTRRSNDRVYKMIAKLDLLAKPLYSRKGCVFRFIPQNTPLIAKLDSSIVKLVPL